MSRAYAAPLDAVDRLDVLGTGPQPRLRAYKRVTADDPYLAGHFPGLTMLPAVFLLETLRQAGAEVTGLAHPEIHRIDSVRLLAPMLGGDEILAEVTVRSAPEEHRWALDARCSGADGTPVATVKLVLGPAEHPVARVGFPPAEPAPPPDSGCWAGHAWIREQLPVRHPMLLVDRITALEPGAEIRTEKAVNGSEPCYQGLPDGLPATAYGYPRSLVLESFGQSAALLCLAGNTVSTRDRVMMLGAIRECHFDGLVYPGEVLRPVVRLEKLTESTAIVGGSVWSGSRRVAMIESLIAVSRPRSVVFHPDSSAYSRR